jgi:hypothetical protein
MKLPKQIHGPTTFGPCPRPRGWTRTRWGWIAPNGELESNNNAARLAREFPIDDTDNIFRRSV